MSFTLLSTSHRPIEKFRRHVAPIVWPFFKRYPYHGELDIVRADARGAISSEERFFYNRIPKNANSTIIKTLVEHSCKVRGIPSSDDHKNFYKRPAFASRKLVKDFPGFFKFIFFRNPYTRTLSAYLEKVKRGNHRLFVQWKMRNRITEPASFALFCDYLNDGGLCQDPHWAPQVHNMLLPYDDYDFIGRFERLDGDLNSVINRIFNDTDTAQTNMMGHKTNAGKKLSEHYGDREISLISSLYKQDFERLDYSFEIAEAHCAPE